MAITKAQYEEVLDNIPGPTQEEFESISASLILMGIWSDGTLKYWMVEGMSLLHFMVCCGDGATIQFNPDATVKTITWEKDGFKFFIPVIEGKLKVTLLKDKHEHSL